LWFSNIARFLFWKIHVFSRNFENLKGLKESIFRGLLLVLNYFIKLRSIFLRNAPHQPIFFPSRTKVKKNSSAVSISEKSSKLHFVFYNNHLNLKILKIDFLKDFFFEIKNNFSYLFLRIFWYLKIWKLSDHDRERKWTIFNRFFAEEKIW